MVRRTPDPMFQPDDWAERAASWVAGFTSTRSKLPGALYGDPAEPGPTHFRLAHGCEVTATDGRVYLDWTMALGAVGLGYGFPEVADAASRAAYQGGVGPLAPVLEVELAERLVRIYPGADRVRFFKTGAEAVAAAVRLARAVTDRDDVVHCGYHGWLDGPTSGLGVPHSASELWHPVPFNDCEALEAAVKRWNPAALVLETVIEGEPTDEWFRCARALADSSRALLVLDEIKTGYRLGMSGAVSRWFIRPDMAVLGKALANGFPLAALVGAADIMDAVDRTWISSTLATEAVSLAAALAVVDTWRRVDVGGHISMIGRMLRDALEPLCRPPLVEWRGMPEMWLLRFADEGLERRFLARCRERGLLLKRGAYNFPSYSHSQEHVEMTIDVIRDALKDLS
jgi:glutamate-1-semialdehyde aminotransferase